jgi:gluconate 5-dehydrogenase
MMLTKAFAIWLEARTLAGRWGQADELVDTLIYLCPPASGFVHGQVIYVDSGMKAVV